MILTYGLAVLAACANATSSVLQRKANRDAPQKDNLSWKLIRDLLHEPVWFGGILAITAGFLLQATALGTGDLATVEPVLVLELPITLILAARVFRLQMGWRELGSSAAMAAGLSGLLYALSPSPGRPGGPRWYVWAIGIGASMALIAVLVARDRRERAGRSGGRPDRSGSRQAALLGVAAGSAFGLTAALMKGMTQTFAGGAAALFTSWPLYAMIAAGVLGMFLAQSALNGRLLAAQPGLTLTDPVVATTWGVLVFGERVRGGLFIVVDVVSVAVIAAAVLVLARSPLLADHGDRPRAPSQPGPQAPAGPGSSR